MISNATTATGKSATTARTAVTTDALLARWNQRFFSCGDIADYSPVVKRLEEQNMTKMHLESGAAVDFIARGKRLARSGDRGKASPEACIITFGDPEDVAQLLTQARIGVFRAVKEEAASITLLANRLHRDRSAVKRDVDALLDAGLVSVAIEPNAGHGTHKIVRAVASTIYLRVIID
jgi:predicted transcriptional regulator